MNIAMEDLTCPNCGKWIATRKEIRDHLTLKLCQSPPAFGGDSDRDTMHHSPARPDDLGRKPLRSDEEV